MTKKALYSFAVMLLLIINAKSIIYAQVNTEQLPKEVDGYYAQVHFEQVPKEYDIDDYQNAVQTIKAIQDIFRKWDSLSDDTRRKLESAHQYAWLLMSWTYGRTSDPELKKRIFLFYNANFETDGKHLASLLHEIPMNSPIIPEIFEAQFHFSSEFLTESFWNLLRRTEDPAVVACIAAIIYRTDSATGYKELELKKTQLLNESLSSLQKDLIMYYIDKTLGYHQNYKSVPFGKSSHSQGVVPASVPPTFQLHSNLPQRVPYKRVVNSSEQ